MDKTFIASEIQKAKELLARVELNLDTIFQDSQLAPRTDAGRETPQARRSCPSCSKTIMAAATRCGYCWTKLEPPPFGAAG